MEKEDYLNVAAAAEVEEAESADEDDAFDAVENVKEEVIEEGRAEKSRPLPPP